MTTIWFDRRPGEPAAKPLEDGSGFVLSVGVPDWVRLPQELGGGPQRVQGAHRGPCLCGDDHKVRHLITTDLGVAECELAGFLWYILQRTDT